MEYPKTCGEAAPRGKSLVPKASTKPEPQFHSRVDSTREMRNKTSPSLINPQPEMDLGLNQLIWELLREREALIDNFFFFFSPNLISFWIFFQKSFPGKLACKAG